MKIILVLAIFFLVGAGCQSKNVDLENQATQVNDDQVVVTEENQKATTTIEEVSISADDLLAKLENQKDGSLEKDAKAAAEKEAADKAAAEKEAADKAAAEKYATVLKLYDSKGNYSTQSEHNYEIVDTVDWPQPFPVLNVGEDVTITVDVANNLSEPVLYAFNGRGFPSDWQTQNYITVNINNEDFNTEMIHLRVFIKNSDNQFRAPDYDDMIQVFYTKQ